MKSYRLTVFLIALLVGGLSSTAIAQYDDLYYDPDTDSEYYSSKDNYSNSGNDSYYITNEDEGYDNAEYGYYDDDYDYYYSSRIRRFHRPYYGFGYFDPVYVDMYYYDPFFTPGMTVLIYDNFYSYRSWNRWNRWNRWNSWDPWYGGTWGYNAWSPWNVGWGYNPWSPWGPRNSFYFGYNSFGGGFYNAGFYGGGYSSFYCPPSWGNGYVYNTAATVNNTYYGPRTSGTVRVPNTSKRDLGIQQEPAKDVTNQAPRGRVSDGVSRRDSPNAIPETSTERSRVTGRETEVTRSRTYNTSPREVAPAPTTPRYDRSGSDRSNSNTRNRSYTPPSQPRRDYTPPSSRNNTRTQPSSPSPRTYERNSSPSPRTYERNNSGSNRSSSGYNRSNSGSNRSSSGYNRSSGSSRSSGSYSPSRSSGSSSRSFNSGSSGGSSRSYSSGSSSSRSSSSGSSSGSSRSSSSSSSSRRGGN